MAQHAKNLKNSFGLCAVKWLDCTTKSADFAVTFTKSRPTTSSDLSLGCRTDDGVARHEHLSGRPRQRHAS